MSFQQESVMLLPGWALNRSVHNMDDYEFIVVERTTPVVRVVAGNLTTRAPNAHAQIRALRRWCSTKVVGCIALEAALLMLMSAGARAAEAPTNHQSPFTDHGSPTTEPPLPTTPREAFNAGRLRLRAGKLREAEALLETSMASQNERLQPPALYNLGLVRFGQGAEDLKKGPPARPTAKRAQAAASQGEDAVRQADQALAGNELEKLVAAYLRGRGARKELKAATEAVRQAVDAHRAALGRWQRSSGDFRS